MAAHRLAAAVLAASLVAASCSDNAVSSSTSTPAEATTTVPSSTTATAVSTSTTTATGAIEAVLPVAPGWPVSTPEEQGMHSGDLARMVESIISTGLEVDSVSVVRHGFVVLHATFTPYTGDRPHIVHSVTKSITGTLIGLAIDEGLLEGVDVPVVEVLAADAPADPGPLKASMTVEDLLMMSAGLDCRDSYLYNWAGLWEMRATDDWAAHVLALPMSEPPGTVFEYCNGASYLLSAIVTEVAGEPAVDFAREHLFGPLGITDLVWAANAEEINHGWGDLYLYPLDLARIGQTVLQDGVWEGEQVIPAAWLEAATTPRATALTLSDTYGYQWWIDAAGYVMAIGYGGQYLIIDHEHDLVVVFTSGTGSGFSRPEAMYRRYVVGAVEGDEPLPADPEANAALAAAVAHAAEAPAATPFTHWPLEGEITGVTWLLDDNAGGFEWLRLTFDGETMVMELEDVDGPIEVTVPLDGRFHESEAWGRPWAWRPEWEDGDTLVVAYQILGATARGEFRFSFDDERLWFRFWESVSGTDQRAEGTPEG